MKLCFQIVLKLFKEGLVRINCGSAFHNFEAEYKKERSYNAVRDLGTERSPFSTEALEGHFDLLLITYYLLLITYYLLLITYYLLLITYYLLLIILFITPITAGNSKYTFPVTAVAVVVVVIVVVAVYL